MSLARAPALLALLAVAPVHAQERPLNVTLTVAGAPDEAAALTASVRELVERLQLSLGASTDDALARVKVELRADECLVSVSNRAGDVVSFRRVPRGPSTQVTLEAVAHVVQSAVEELAELERHPPVRRVPLSGPPLVEVPSVAASTAQPSVSGPTLEVGAFGSGRAFGDGAVTVLGGGLSVSTRLGEGRWAPRLSLLASYNGPFERSNDVVSLSTQSFSARLLAGAQVRLGNRFALDLQAGGGVDGLVPMMRSTTLPPPALSRPHVELSPVLTALAGARLRVTPSAELFVAVTGDLDLLPRRFLTDIQGEREVLFESWTVRPALVLGFSFDVLEATR